jgi:hypothetical protein
VRVSDAVAAVGKALSGYVFRVRSEAELQEQVSRVLLTQGWGVAREVRLPGARLDIVVSIQDGPYALRIVLELKLQASAAEVERQAQRYAIMDDVDAVGVVTTSSTLAASLGSATKLGWIPFFVVALRTT